MVKKGKKDDKAAADDVFEPLSIEAKNAQTAVLMLTSPEDDVLTKTCEAIYKFVLKNSENIKLMLDLNSIDLLLKLLVSEEKVVRRNAIMALAGMTTHSDVRKYLRKISDAIPIFLRLTNPEEYDTTIEFATLALCNMSQEYASIAAIHENNGLPALIECLKMDDPDIIKNAVETITQLLQDFEVNAVFKDAIGLDALLDLLSSEYAIIQELALKAFIRATVDSGNRAALREKEVLGKFVDIIGNPLLNDLHVFALQVVSNCADDVESLQQLKESGALLKLVYFIMDQTPPVDEQKEAKGKGKKGSAKKKKGGDEDKDEKLPSHTLPEVKMHAAKAIMRCSRIADNRRILHECETEKMLVALLTYDDDKVRSSAAHALAVMAESYICQEAIVKFEGLEHLLKMTKMENKEFKEVGSLALANLTTGNNTIAIEIAQHHGIEHLLSCLSNDHERIVTNGLTGLINMATDDTLRNKALHLGIIGTLATPLASNSILVQQKAAMAVAAFVVDPGTALEFKNSGGLPHLVGLLLSNSCDVRKAVYWAISLLAQDNAVADEIYKLKGLEVLQKINESPTKKTHFSELAMRKLLDNNLPVKYAILGELEIMDRIPDVFYDAGQIRPTGQLLSLEEYHQQLLNSKRPVLLLNAIPPPKQITPTASDIIEETASKDSQVSKEKRSSKSRIGKGEEDETKDKKSVEVSEPAELHQSMVSEAETEHEFKVPDDSNLRNYIQEITSLIREARTSVDEIMILASFVSEKMGGSIEPGQLMSFDYELPISELKTSLKSNVIPIGMISRGIFYHRALLFKFLADKVGINCSLFRGSYNRAWNQVWLSEANEPPTEYLVDLMFEPGRILRHDTFEASSYKKLS